MENDTIYHQLDFSGGQLSIKKESGPDTAFSILLLFAWSNEIFITCFKGVLRRIVGYEFIVTAITDLIIVAAILGSIKIFMQYLKKRDFLIYAIFISIYIISGIIHPITREYVFNSDTLYVVFIKDMPFFFLGLILRDKYIDKLYSISLFAIYLYFIFAFVFHRLSISSDSGSDVGVGYMLLKYTSVVLAYNIKKPTLFGIMTFILGMIILIGAGSRGPVGCLVIIVVILFIKGSGNSNGRKVLLISILAVASIIIYINLYTILNWLSSTIGTIGMSTRVIDSFLSSSITDDNGRREILNFLNEKIQANPLGYGIGYDHLFWFKYAHNIKTEMLVGFGVLFGNIIFYGLLALFIYSIIFEKRQKNLILNCAEFFGVGFLKLFISSSYLLEPGFFLLIGLSISSIRYNVEESKKKKNPFGRFRKEEA